MKLRMLLHAMDRTGPPMLGRALAREVVQTDGIELTDVLAFRGGPLEPSFRELAPTTVMLEDHEPWDHERPLQSRVDQLTASLADLHDADVSLLVSVAAGQCLMLLPRPSRTVVWVVEQGEDLHWLDPPVQVAERTDLWLAGNRGSARELRERLGPDASIELSTEFIESTTPDRAEVGRVRHRLLGDDAGPLIMGAGIGTRRKAPDLFLEVAIAYRAATGAGRFVWVGGESDPLIPLLRTEVERLRASTWLTFVDSVERLEDWIAAADVFCLTSRLDAYPLVCLHAAAVGTPVLAFGDTTGVPDMFGDDFCGVDFPDIAGLVDLLVTSTPNQLRALGAAQQRHAERHMASAAAPALVEHLVRACGVLP